MTDRGHPIRVALKGQEITAQGKQAAQPRSATLGYGIQIIVNPERVAQGGLLLNPFRCNGVSQPASGVMTPSLLLRPDLRSGSTKGGRPFHRRHRIDPQEAGAGPMRWRRRKGLTSDHFYVTGSFFLDWVMDS